MFKINIGFVQFGTKIMENLNINKVNVTQQTMYLI